MRVRAHLNSLVSLLTLSIAPAGCTGEAKDKAPAAAKPAPAVTAPGATTASPVPPAPAASPSVPAVDAAMVELDLSPADPVWAGWVAEGPASVKVMKDGVKGARIAGGKRDEYFDVNWVQKKKDLAELKANLKRGDEASQGMKLTFVKDEPGVLEWTSEASGKTTHSFVMHMTVDNVTITCGNNYMVGIASEAMLEQHKRACQSLKKKG
ncbi:MAG: hypothetical protein H0T89_10385 [Deltaproteobacteria bacterium]|nr:hypothetical protein [Deltaproteobacteria bacterium]MDQ3296355.1 hypothetical protein [Myxococcota bacterium]